MFKPLRILAVFLLAVVVSCTPAGSRKLIVSVNEAQDAAAHTYDTAKAVETDATLKCRAALVAASKPLPARPEEVGAFCAAVGAPLPYDPVKLAQASIAINSLYDGVRSANEIRKAQNLDSLPATIYANLLSLFVNVTVEMTDAGVTVPPSVTAIADELKKASTP